MKKTLIQKFTKKMIKYEKTEMIHPWFSPSFERTEYKERDETSDEFMNRIVDFINEKKIKEYDIVNVIEDYIIPSNKSLYTGDFSRQGAYTPRWHKLDQALYVIYKE